jgi:hypothetical protein
LGHEVSEFSIAQHERLGAPIDWDLPRDLKRRREWFNEYRLVDADFRRDNVQIPLWHGHIVGKGAVMSENPQNGTSGAMVC